MIQLVFLFALCVAYKFAFGISILGTVKLIFNKIFIEFFFFSVLISTLTWYISNKYLKTLSAGNQDVEWLYSFDIHCNGYFCYFMISSVLQFFLLPVLIQNTFYSLIIGNSLYFIAFGYYCFITSRGLAGNILFLI
jgi:hypothetical protein